METIDVFLSSLLAVFCFFWIIVFVLYMPKIIEFELLGILTVLLLIKIELRRLKKA